MQDISKIRNIAIIGHGSCGKTSLAEAMLYTAGKIKRLGKVDEGTSALDFEDEEIKRNVSINNSFHNYSWKKHDVYFMDTPGDDNFLNEAYVATQVVDGAVFIIGAVLGVKGQTIKFADFIASRKLPSLIMINKLDRERADFTRTIDQIKESLPVTPVILHLPIGEEDSFRGLVDLVSQKAYLFDESGKGTLVETDIPDDMADDVALYRESLMEQVAETDDDLIEKFLEDGELSQEDLQSGLKGGVASGAIVPVCLGAATSNFGTSALLDVINDIMPSPADRPNFIGVDKNGEPVERKAAADEKFSAQVFKTMADPYAGRLTIFRIYSGTLSGDTFYNSSKETDERFGQLFIPEGKEQRAVESAGPGMIVAVAKLKETTTGDTLCDASAPIIYDDLDVMEPVISYAIRASKGDEEKLFSSITRMLDEDLTLRLSREPQTGEVLISGVGKVHLDVVGAKIKRKFGVEMELSLPKVPYKETIRGTATVQGKHKKQSGGRGQFGDCTVEIGPNSGKGFEFEDKIVGGVIPQQYRPAVEKGILEAMEKGVMAGYPVVDIKVSLIDGSYHNVDSSEMAFKIAGSLAFKKGAQEAGLVLLEPFMNMTIVVGKEHVGDIMGDLNSRRGKVMGMDADQGREIIKAQVPQAEVLLYAADLTAMTGGLGTFTVSFSHYEEVPAMIAEKVVAANQAE
ncbi:translation elongation factor 2 (EF-2/EF-G) [Desulfocapsa sulfexigens DSM 10523]|uniref:Elongation factor G n=1 Tax=Desulfocapsa sulfexigens (strain DSM 10523 / SB164P1) TaxID=1167006 RepID=M1NJC4_DESSD|nr:elongation factor G [Desulfocapsa sulfexigens]AGF79664.1 translation elongation factor 2 (EF-2/EF-G) [Desulfocapsa sulfexigens DSM 10523]